MRADSWNRYTRESIVADATQLAIEIGGLHRQLRERGDDRRVFVAPVESGPGQQLHPSTLCTRRHAEAVDLDFVNPLRP